MEKTIVVELIAKPKEMRYRCTNCGEEHEEYPALGFLSPYHYDILTDQEKQEKGQLSSDTCIITHEEQIDRFIRGVLVQKINDSCQDLDYGLWVSLSANNYRDYIDNFHSENHETTYFGWLSSNIPEYESTLSIKTTVHTRGNQRPLIVIQESNDKNIPFVKDYFEGITKKEAEERINNMMKSLGT